MEPGYKKRMLLKARIFPHGAWSRIHRYQHLYLPFLYPFYLLNWLLISDFKDFFDRRRPLWKVTVIPAREYAFLFGFKHQLRNTNDVAHDNWFVRWCMGSFNYHVAHHLFPTVSHVYYPAITRMLREEAEKNHWPYRSYPLITTLVNHYRLLKPNRRPENIFEEVL